MCVCLFHFSTIHGRDTTHFFGSISSTNIFQSILYVSHAKYMQDYHHRNFAYGKFTTRFFTIMKLKSYKMHITFKDLTVTVKDETDMHLTNFKTI